MVEPSEPNIVEEMGSPHPGIIESQPSQPDQLQVDKEVQVHPVFLENWDLIINEANKGNQQATAMVAKVAKAKKASKDAKAKAMVTKDAKAKTTEAKGKAMVAKGAKANALVAKEAGGPEVSPWDKKKNTITELTFSTAELQKKHDDLTQLIQTQSKRLTHLEWLALPTERTTTAIVRITTAKSKEGGKHKQWAKMQANLAELQLTNHDLEVANAEAIHSLLHMRQHLDNFAAD